LFHTAFHTTSQSPTVDEVLPTTAVSARNNYNTPQPTHEYSTTLHIQAAAETVAMETPSNTTHKLTVQHSTSADVDFITAADEDFTTGLSFWC